MLPPQKLQVVPAKSGISKIGTSSRQNKSSVESVSTSSLCASAASVSTTISAASFSAASVSTSVPVSATSTSTSASAFVTVPSAVSSVFPQAVKENASIELNIIAKIFLFIIFLSFVICFSFLSVDINVPYFVLQWINLF